MESNAGCYGAGNYNNETMMNSQYYNQGALSPNSSTYRQSFPGSNQQFQSPQSSASMSQFQTMPSMPSSSPRHNFSAQIPSSPTRGHTTMHQSHPHLRLSNQNPQDIANNILQMANSSYPLNHTVQVPLSQNRSAPYHVPPRSTPYNYPQQQQPSMDSYGQMGGDYNQAQFMYPANSPQVRQGQRDVGMSPASPASSGMLQSPHSQHSLQSPSSCSMHSPGMGGTISSPVHDMMSDQRRSQVHQQMMNSPQRQAHPQQYMMPPQAPNPGSQMTSPVPPTQQLQVSVSSPVMSQQYYRDSMQSSMNHQYSSPQSHGSSQYSPGIQPTPSPHYQYNSGINTFSPNSRLPASSPQQSQQQSSVHSISKSMQPSNKPGDPLQSLQKLCMLPDSQVVDPKSVVKETCTTDNTLRRPSGDSENSHQSNKQNKVEPPDRSTPNSEKRDAGSVEYSPYKGPDESPEMRCQPKKARLMRAVQDDHMDPAVNKMPDSGNNLEQSNTPNALNNESVGGTENQNSYTTAYNSGNNNYNSNNSYVSSNSQQPHNYRDHFQPNSDGDRVFNTNQASDSGANFQHICSSGDNDKQIQDKSVTSFQSGDKIVTESTFNQQNEVLSQSSNKNCADKSEESHELVETSATEFNENTVEEVTSSQLNDETDMVHSTSGSTVHTSENKHTPSIKVDSIVQLDTIDLIDEAIVGNELDTGTESLKVKKDVTSGYGRKDATPRIETSSRMRVGSTGSLSDERDTSDYEYDHIGCDDIENDYSDLDDRCANVSDAEHNLKNSVESDNDVNEPVVITSTKWKETSKLTCLVKSSKNGAKNKKGRLPSLCVTNNRRSRGLTSLNMDTSVSDSDYEVPSPMGGDVVDGPVGVDNGDGTMSVISAGSRVRQRKTPVKYKDTSFFQGDFVFIEEEEEYLQQYQPRKKETNRIIPVDVNHNARENGRMKSQSTKRKDTKSRTVKEKKKKSNSTVKSSGSSSSLNKQLSESSLSDKQSVEPKEPTKQTKLDISNKTKKEDTEKDSGVENSDIDAKKKVIKENDIKTRSASKSNAAKVSVATRRSTREQSNMAEVQTKTEPVCDTELNGVKKEVDKSPISKVSAPPKLQTRNVPSPVPEVKNTRSRTEVKKDGSEPAVNGAVKVEVIEIESDSDVEIVGQTAKPKPSTVDRNKPLLKPNSNLIDISSFQLIDKMEFSDASDSNQMPNFQFSLIEDSIPSLTMDEKISPNFKVESKPSKKVEPKVKHTPNKKISKPVVTKETMPKKDKRPKKKKRGNDEDPDFDMEPMKNSFKSMKEQDKESKRRKQQKDGWANFKGPKIVLEGEKETPEKCFVINDPFEQIGSKKTRCNAQNVTRIEISHLPSDKSVLIPNNDNLESERWICALCGKHSSYKFLGDLFGPYSVETMSEDLLDLGPPQSLGKKRKSEDGQPGKSGRAGRRSSSMSKEVSEWKEVWVHESCAVYSDGVFLIGSKIYGLQEAVRIASQTVSTY